MDSTGDIRADTRFFEGLYNGTKFSIVHALTYAPYFSKERSLLTGRSFPYEYTVHCGRAFLFYAGIMSATFGMRHLVMSNKLGFTNLIEDSVPVLKEQRTLIDVLLYAGFCWPIGFTINYLMRGRYLRGGPMMTLFVALVLYNIENGE